MDITALSSPYATRKVTGQHSAAQSEESFQSALAAASGQRDDLSISDQALQAVQNSGLFGAAMNNQGQVDMTSFRRVQEDRTSDFNAKLSTYFAKAKIDGSKPAKLELGEDGRVHVMGSHPDKAKIEAMFAANPELTDDFAKIAGGAKALKEVELGDAVTVEYLRGNTKEGAMERFKPLFEQLARRTRQATFKDGKLTIDAIAEG